MKFLKKLESIKDAGAYSLNVIYGEGIGCDDGDVPMNERSIQVIFTPVGVLGSARIFWRGTVKTFLMFDFAKEKPKKVSNPPDAEALKADGYYVWGTDDSVGIVLNNPSL